MCHSVLKSLFQTFFLWIHLPIKEATLVADTCSQQQNFRGLPLLVMTSLALGCKRHLNSRASLQCLFECAPVNMSAFLSRWRGVQQRRALPWCAFKRILMRFLTYIINNMASQRVAREVSQFIGGRRKGSECRGDQKCGGVIQLILWKIMTSF